MPGAYGSIFILCMNLSWKMPASGAYFFSILAWLQGIAWLCDIIENIYLLGKIHRNPIPSSHSIFKAYQYLEVLKWGCALLGAVCGLSSLLYFWLAGSYAFESLYYILIIGIEVVVFLVAGKLIKRSVQRRLNLAA
jgi:hypothetical protein